MADGIRSGTEFSALAFCVVPRRPRPSEGVGEKVAADNLAADQVAAEKVAAEKVAAEKEPSVVSSSRDVRAMAVVIGIDRRAPLVDARAQGEAPAARTSAQQLLIAEKLAPRR